MKTVGRTPIVVAVALVALGLGALTLWGRGGEGDGTPADREAAPAGREEAGSPPSGGGDALDATGVHRGAAAADGRGDGGGEGAGAAGAAPARGSGTSSPPAAADAPLPSATDWGGADPAGYPMALEGASRGIDTAMGPGWSPEQEARQWLEPLETDLRDARPLTPDRYRAVIAEHREDAIDVLQRAAEIADLRGPDAGMAFLDEYNRRLDTYRQETREGRSP